MRRVRVALLIALASCSEERATPGGNGNGGGGRDAGTSAGDAGTGAGGGGDVRLRAGEIDLAFEAYRARATPGDAFGACLTRTLRIAASPAVTSVLARFGVAPVPLADIAGTRGIMVRRAEAWRGDAAITEAGGARTTFGRARARATSVTAADYPTGARVHASFYGASLPAPGTRIPLRFDCPSGSTQGTRDVTVSFRSGTRTCYLAQSQPPGAACQQDGGTIEATQLGTRSGDAWSVKLEDVLLSCGTGPAPQPLRISGELHARYTPSIDVTGLHPLLADLFDGGFDPAPYASALSAGTRLDPIVKSLAPLVSELDLASEDCARAGQGTGVVFTLPGTLYGGVDLPITAADAKLAAGLLGAASAGIQIALAYDHPLELASLCTPSECVQDPMLVERIDAALPSYANRPLMGARTTLDRALGLFIAGIDAAGPEGVLPKDGETTAGLAHWRAWLGSIQSSLTGGGVAFPSVSPVVRIDLRALFAGPPDFSRAMTDPLVYDRGIRWVEAFGQETLDRFLDLEWSGSYDSPDEARDPADAFVTRLERAGMVIDD